MKLLSAILQFDLIAFLVLKFNIIRQTRFYINTCFCELHENFKNLYVHY